MKKRVFGYYESIALSNQAEEFSLANIWKASWEKQGWEPVMLNRSHAQGSPLYIKLVSRLMKLVPLLPAENQSRLPWILARFTRLGALQAAGGGWMSDYDVVNTGFTPEIAEELERKSTLSIVGPEPAWVLFGTRDHVGAAVHKILLEEILENGVIRGETEILGVLSGLEEVRPLLHHVTGKDRLLRAEEIFTNPPEPPKTKLKRKK